MESHALSDSSYSGLVGLSTVPLALARLFLRGVARPAGAILCLVFWNVSLFSSVAGKDNTRRLSHHFGNSDRG